MIGTPDENGAENSRPPVRPEYPRLHITAPRSSPNHPVPVTNPKTVDCPPPHHPHLATVGFLRKLRESQIERDCPEAQPSRPGNREGNPPERGIADSRVVLPLNVIVATTSNLPS